MRKKLTWNERLRGCCRVELTGCAPWRILNRFTAAGIIFRSAESIDPVTVRLTLYERELPVAENLCRQGGGGLKKLSSHGTGRAISALHRNLVLCGAMTAAFLALLGSSLFVWDIRVTENDTPLSSEKILSVLRSHGVGIGSYAPAINSDRIRAQVLPSLPELSYLSVNVRGSRANVIVRGADEVPELYIPSEGTDVVSTATGIITRLTVLEGERLVQVGDAVQAGQVLIDAERLKGTGEARTVHARGEVWARTYRTMTAVCPLETMKAEEADRSGREITVILGTRQIKIFKNSGNPGMDCVRIKVSDWFPLSKKTAFPLGLSVRTRQPCIPVPSSDSVRELSSGMEEELLTKLRQELGEDGSVISARFSRSEDAGRIYVTLRAECEERIDREIPHIPSDSG